MAAFHVHCSGVSGGIERSLYPEQNNGDDGRRMYWELTKANIPLVGCRANEIENLLTAQPRVASEKEKHRYLKCTTANRKRA